MKDRLLTTVSVVSLLLCAATVVVWVLGSHSAETLYFDHDGQAWEAFSRGGTLGVDNVPEVQRRLDQRNVLVEQWFDAESKRSHFAGELEVYLREHPSVDLVEDGSKLKEWRDECDAAKARATKLKAKLASTPWPPVLGFTVRAWWLATASAILPALWILRRKAMVRAVGSGRCAACGYDLTGNTSGVCPECGTPGAVKVVT